MLDTRYWIPVGGKEILMDTLQLLDREQMRTDIPQFKPGDTVKVHVRIREGDKERIQVFSGGGHTKT